MGDALNRRLAATFRQELDDQLRAMNADLLVLEREPTNPERLMAVFRGAHTLKGAARAVGLSDIEATCHDLEGLLAEARDGKRVLGADDFAGIFSTLDTLARAGARIGLTEDAHASAATTPRTPAPPPAPSPAPTAAPSSAPSSAPPGRAPPPARPPLRDAS
ncbi:MAG: Hpt domain-containing protein, partial [Gemmatimonadota bacterium]|nr:Hpt domain-containing protein [Gemmatimonadota bacterium]